MDGAGSLPLDNLIVKDGERSYNVTMASYEKGDTFAVQVNVPLKYRGYARFTYRFLAMKVYDDPGGYCNWDRITIYQYYDNSTATPRWDMPSESICGDAEQEGGFYHDNIGGRPMLGEMREIYSDSNATLFLFESDEGSPTAGGHFKVETNLSTSHCTLEQRPT